MLEEGGLIKVCLNCGDKLLEKALKCPHCGEKAKNFPLVNKTDIDRINAIISSVPNPKSGQAKWQSNKKEGFWAKLNEQVNEINQSKAQEKQYQKERKKQMDRDGIAYCPKCKSTSLSANKKGFGIGKAVVGAAMTGGLGLVAGNIGAKKVRVTCLKCGHQFWAGKK